MAGKSLGTLTLDLVAKIGGFVDGMSKAERETKRRMDGVERSVNSAGKAIAGLSAAAATTAAAIVTKVALGAREIENLSKVANVSASEFQRIAYASEQFGIQQDKVADILKDVNDKVGDFLTTGAGPMADFFESVAPLVGVTADNFRDLSGKDALQLYVSTLEKANVSQAEMTFFMEAIASDATVLLPLLRDSGKELGRLGDQAESLNAVLSDLEIQQLNEVANQTRILEGAFDGLANQVTIALLPAMTDLSKLFSDRDTIENIAAISSGIGNIAASAVRATSGLVGFTKYLAEALAASVNGPAADDIVRISDQIYDLETQLENFKSGLEGSTDDDFSLAERLLGAPERIREDFRESIATTEAELKKLYALRDLYESGVKKPAVAPLPESAASAGAGTKSKSFVISEDQKKLNEEFAKTLLGYQRQIELSGDLSEAEKLRFEIATGSLKGITDAQRQELEANAQLIDSYNELAKASEKRGEFLELQSTLLSSSGSPELDALLATYEDRQGIIESALIDEAITRQEYDQAMLDLDRVTAEERKRIMAESAAATVNTMASIISITESQVAQMQQVFGEAGEIGKAFYVVSQGLAAANAVIHGIQSAMAIRVAYAQMAAMAGPGAPGILAIGEGHAQAAQAMGFVSAGIIGAQTIASFEGGGYTWDGPRSGGMDGKGGRLALMHPNEKIIDLEKNGDGGVVVNVHNAPAGTRTESRTEADGRQIIDVIISDVNSGGPFFKALQSRTGIARQGR